MYTYIYIYICICIHTFRGQGRPEAAHARGVRPAPPGRGDEPSMAI